MRVGRAVSTLLSCAAVGGCAVVVLGMARAGTTPTADERDAAPTAVAVERGFPATTPSRAVTSAVPAPATTDATRTAVPRVSTSAAAPRSSAAPPVAVAPRTTAAARRTAAPPTTAAPRTTATPRTTAAPRTTARPAPAVAGSALPLRYSTGTATRVVTVTAPSSGSTVATLQAWSKVSAGRWRKVGSAVTAHVGADGIGKASETRSKTPAGSWTLTQAFGRNADPGTALPYFRTNPRDFWISSPGAKYNTHQRCGSCGYANGVNEQLYYETPYYNWAVVIDYNTRNAPGGVHQGAGSAFFLHVTDGRPTAGCVAIPASRLTSLMRWLTPSAHPRVLIGVV